MPKFNDLDLENWKEKYNNMRQFIKKTKFMAEMNVKLYYCGNINNGEIKLEKRKLNVKYSK